MKKKNLKNKTKATIRVNLAYSNPWRVATSLEQWFTIFKIHYKSKRKLSGYFNRDDNNWSQKKRKGINEYWRYATSAWFLHEHGREASELLVSSSPAVLSSGRSAEPSSTGPESGQIRRRSFSIPCPSPFFFLLPLYYRCRFFSGIRGADIPLWQAAVLQAEQISTFPQPLFGEANVCFRRNIETNVGKLIGLYIHMHASIDHVRNANGGCNRSAVVFCGNYILPLPRVYRYIPINRYSTRLCD